MLIELALITITSLLLYIYWKQYYSEYAVKLNKFAGNKIVPIFGNILEIQGTTEDVFNFFRNRAQKFKESYRIWSAHLGNVNIIKAEDVEFATKKLKMIVELILITISSLLLYIYWRQSFSEYAYKLNKFSGTKIVPIFGNVLEMQGTTEDVFNFFRNRAQMFKESYRVWSAHLGIINLTKAEDVEFARNKMILELILLTITSFFLYVYWRQTFSDYALKLNKFTGNKITPIIGNVGEMQGTTEDVFNTFRNRAIKFGESYRAWSLHIGIVNIVKAEDVEIILSSNKHIDKSLIYEFIEPWLGTGLLTGTGAKWQHRRKLLTPAFHFNILRRFVQTFGEQSMKLVEDLKKECSQEKTNVYPYITNSTLQVICETAMGTTLDPKDEVQKRYLQAIYDMGKIVMKRIVSPWLYNHTIFNMTPIGWRNNKAVKTLHSFTNSVIKEREANFKDSDVMDLDKKMEDEDDGIYKKKKLAMLDLLLSAKKNNNSIDDEGLREEVDTFMFEGHDTTSSGISLALVLLANHKDVQKKIFVELDEVFGNSKRPANYDDLQKLPYLDMCIKECMRIFPPVPIIARHLYEDLKLSKYVAPAGTILNIHILDLHRDPTVFPDPMKFDPDRFLPENCKGRHPYAYVPFSAGARNCIGQKFAMLEIKSILSAIFRNFELEAIDKPEDMRFIVDFVLRTQGEVNIKFKERII